MADAKRVRTLLASHFRLSKEQCPEDEEKDFMAKVSYASGIGSLVRIPVLLIGLFRGQTTCWGLNVRVVQELKVEDQRPFHNLKGQARQRYNLLCLVSFEENQQHTLTQHSCHDCIYAYLLCVFSSHVTFHTCTILMYVVVCLYVSHNSFSNFIRKRPRLH